MRKYLVVSFLAMTGTVPLTAQEKTKAARLPGDEMIEKYLAAETDKLSKKFMDGATTLAEWKEKLPRLKREYMDMLGLWPIPEKTPLKATVTGQLEAHDVIVEKIHFQSKPGLYVTANLYRPRALDGKRVPAVLYVCGHSGKGRDGCKTAFQDHGFWFANNGYVCLIVDTLQLGEIPGVHHGIYGVAWRHLKSWGLDVPTPGQPVAESPLLPKGADPSAFRPWWWSMGYTPAGVECWNGIRAIDYLQSRPEVDPDKIGVTGISGGGAATFWIAAADERVKVAVPVSGMSDLEFYVKNKGVNGHCDCMFLHNTYQWDWTTIAALVAPRPLLFANSDNDPIFPMDGNRRIMAKLKKCYALFPAPPVGGAAKPRDERSDSRGSSAEGLVAEYVSVGGHDYRPDLRGAIFQFFNRHLKGDPTAKVEDSAKYTPLPGKDLRVFPTDADLPKDAINGRIDETFVARGKVELPKEGKFKEWKKQLVAELANRCFRSFPEAPASKTSSFGQVAMSLRLPRFTEEHVEATLVYFGVGEKRSELYQLLILEDEKIVNHIDVPKWAASFSTVNTFGLFPRGTDEWTWKSSSPPNFVERCHVLLGRTPDQGRTWDAIARIRQQNAHWKGDGSWRAIGRGKNGILAAYAALFEPSIKEVVVIDPPKSHKEGPYFLGVQKVLDIPEALGLLAPTPLTIIGGADPAFDRTAEIYRLAGAADKLKRK